MRPSQGFGEPGNSNLFQKNKGTKVSNWGTKAIWGTGNIENQDFDFGDQGKMPIYFRGIREKIPPPGGPYLWHGVTDRSYCPFESQTWTVVQCFAAADSIVRLRGGRMSIYRNQLLCGFGGSRGHGSGTLGF